MAEGIVAGLRGDWTLVVQTVKAVFLGKPFLLLCEDRDATERPHFKPARALDENIRFPRGRAFDKEREVRWRETTRGKFAITYLSETHAPPAQLGLQSTGHRWTTRETRQKLFGKWSDSLKDWVEVSVPGISKTYHALVQEDPPNLLQIAAVDYYCEGVAQTTRYRAIQEFEE